MYIDTEKTFRPEKFVKMSRRFGIELNNVLNQVVYSRAKNVDQQFELLVLAAVMMAIDKYDFKAMQTACMK